MITIFTPTFNRAHTLKRLYESLLSQTLKDFEWLIIDDGSTDDTKILVESFQSTSFSIRYYFQENQGKHVAINKASLLAKGEWFFIVDSDDYLPSHSIEIILSYCNQIKDNPRFAGVAGRRMNPSTKVFIGNKRNELVMDATASEFMKRNIGDQAEVIRTSLLQKYPFPVFRDEKFMQESVLWLSLSNDGYLFRWFNEGVYFTEYLEDGLTRNGKTISKRNPLSKSYAENHIVGSKGISFKIKLKSCINYYRYGIFGGRSLNELFQGSNNKLLSLFAIIIALIYPVK